MKSENFFSYMDGIVALDINISLIFTTTNMKVKLFKKFFEMYFEY